MCRIVFLTEEVSYHSVHTALVALSDASALIFHVLPWDGVFVWVGLAMFIAVVASQLSSHAPTRVFLVLHTLTSVVVGAAGEFRLFPEA